MARQTAQDERAFHPIGHWSVRPAIAADLAELGHVETRAWRAAYAGLLPAAGLARLSPEAKARDFARALALGEPAVFVAQTRGRLLGFGTAGPQRSRDLARRGFGGEVSMLYLLPEAQGQGIGRALMAELARHLDREGAGGLALWVLARNAAARGFYARLGGTPVAQRPTVWGGQGLSETAYGWQSLAPLLPPVAPG